MTQLDLIPQFDGADYQPSRDRNRLCTQLERISLLMRDGRWRSVDTIHQLTGDPHASISAQIRNLRKARFGGHTVERRYVGDGLYEFRVIL
jgi:hypothetical protein